ncbi:ABC-2 type transport system permease protein [Orbus hercynius]|uniref:ABC-2 type transport system permease protein n=1 Tax=Orbus hercynius TaxID=593135 RepID=A0A495RKI8_9GAMM|nr:ABC transporter permease [Orbus hercynius]RKS87676.1 ABC-2 type transport system permease protein [Orbus hercynius]
MKDNSACDSLPRKPIILFMMLRELRLIRKIPSLMIMVFIYPFLIAVTFFSLYHAGSITQVPIAIVDQDQSISSRQLIQRIAASSEIAVSQRFHDLTAAKQHLLNNDIYAIVMIPPNFEQRMLANKQPEVTTFYNNQYMTVGGTANRAISSSLSGYIAEIQLQKIKQSNTPTAIGQNQLKPLAIDTHPLFNPTLSFVYTLVSGVFPAVLQIIMMFTMTATIHLEKQFQPNLNSLRRVANNNPILFFINKSSLYIAIFMVPLLFLDFIMTYYFGLPINGNIFMLIIGDLLFIIAALMIGMMFAIFMPDKLSNFGVIGVCSAPAFGFTGLFFPRLAMNSFAYIWGSLLPVTWYIQLRLDQTLRGLTTTDAFTPIFFMLLLTFVPLCLIGLNFKNKTKRGTI